MKQNAQFTKTKRKQRTEENIYLYQKRCMQTYEYKLIMNF